MIKGGIMDIAENIIEKASRCENKFACLNNKKHVCCKINCSINGEICFINSKDKKPCYYKEGFDITEKCTCPVRIAIHNKKQN